MRTRLLVILVYMLELLVTAGPAHAQASPDWLLVEIGIVGPASEDILNSALEQAVQTDKAGLIVQLDTPGGALETTRSMVKSILGSPIPIAVWVGPSGARAGSAGAFITLAANFAYMAPGTNIGAAHPVGVGGKIDDPVMARKIENDAVAFMESIAQTRGRNQEIANSFVISSLSLTAERAFEEKVIDGLADNPANVLNLIDGKTAKLGESKEVVVASKGANLEVFKKSLRQRLLEILSNPNLFYLLFIAGIIGIGFELTHPGVLLPGVLGGISMILALIATSVLPISFGAMLLILASAAFMVAEIFIPSFGVLGIGGLIGFVIGSVLLVDPGNVHGLRVSLYAILPAALATLGLVLWIGYMVIRVGRAKVQSGSESMLGAQAVALSNFVGGHGRVQINGEDWGAVSVDNENYREGDPVIVTKIEGLLLAVRKPKENEGSLL